MGDRLRRLASDRQRYDAECDRRQQAVDAENVRLDDLINRFARSEPDAVDEYIGIVVGNSIYPDIIAENPDFDFSFNADLRELSRHHSLSVTRNDPDGQGVPIRASL